MSTSRTVGPVSVEEFERLIDKAHWQSARSTEDVAPHQYCVNGWDKDDLTDDEFWAMHATIKLVGRLEEWTPPEEWVRRWGGKPMKNRYLYVGDGDERYAYWFTYPRGRDPMLNREHVSVQERTPTRGVIQEHVDCVKCRGPIRNYGHSDVQVCRECELERHTSIIDGQFVDKFGDAHDLTMELFIARSGWRFAATMPHFPHEYTVRDLRTEDARASSCLSHDVFEWAVRRIREDGEPARWGGREFIYLRVGDHKYWSMGAPSEITTIVNRAQL